MCLIDYINIKVQSERVFPAFDCMLELLGFWSGPLKIDDLSILVSCVWDQVWVSREETMEMLLGGSLHSASASLDNADLHVDLWNSAHF